MKGILFLTLFLGLIYISVQEQPVMLIKNRGKIAFFERTHSIKYDIDTTNYFLNAENILNNTMQIKEACNELINQQNCKTFLINLEDDLKNVNISSNHMKTALSTRGKRWLWRIIRKIFSWKTISKETFSLITGAIVADAVYDARQEEHEKKIHKEINEQMNIMEKKFTNAG